MRQGQFAEGLADLLQDALREQLVGVWLTGSLVLGDFDSATSDIDAAAAVAGCLEEGRRHSVAGRALELACDAPARGVELVLYSAAPLADPGHPPDVQLNVNGGRAMSGRVDYGAPPGEEHWFTVDLEIARVHGRSLAGPAPSDLIAPRDPGTLRAALRASLAWHATNRPSHPDTVLNAARAWLYVLDGRWYSKGTAAALAADNYVPDQRLLREADAARRSGDAVDAARAMAFLHTVDGALAD